VSAVFSQSLDPATVTTTTFRLLDSANTPLPATVSYNGTTNTVSLAPISALNPGSIYKAVLSGGSNGIRNPSGTPMSSDVSWLFTTAQPVSCPCSIWTSSATPSTVDSGGTTALEVGVKFRSDVDGYITGLRFYKGSANTGTHTGHLWSSTGTPLASATFTGETSSGWQQVSFPSAVAITADTTYIASYFIPTGHYSVNLGFFTNAGVDNAPLHLLQNGADGANGVYAYGTTPTFPTTTYQSSNYWVDVVFNTSPGSPTGPTVVSMSPASGASGVSTATSASAVFSQSLDPSTITTTTFRLLDSSNNAIPATVSYNSTSSTITLDPTSALNPASSYTVVLSGGSNGIKSNNGTPMSSDVSWQFTTAQPLNCPCSIWTPSATPSIADSGDTAAVEVGVRFRSDESGYITGLRFYKSSTNTGTHVGHLWSNTGTLLAAATFTGETASGWQQVTFSPAVAVTAGTSYVASYFAPNGHYSRNPGYFTSAGVDNAPLHLLQNGVDGANGVFVYGLTTTFPTSTYQSTNYWVDVVFNTTSSSPVALGSLTVNPTTVLGGTSSTGTVTLTNVAPAGGVEVLLSSSDPAATVPASVLVPESATTATFSIATVSVLSDTGVTITGSYQGQRTALLTVTAPPVISLSSLGVAPTTVVSGTNATGTVTLTGAAPAGGAVVSLAVADPTVATVPASITVAPGATTATFAISTSSVVTSSTTVISASYSGLTRTGTLIVTPAALLSLSITPATVVGGASSTATVTLNGTAPTGGAVVAIATTNAAATVPDTVTVPAGLKTITFTVTTTPVSAATTGTVSGSYNGLVKTSVTLKVNPPALSSIGLTPRTVIGGVSSTGTVTLTGVTAAAETVTLTTNTTAASVPLTVTIPAGASTGTFTVATSPVATATTGTVSGVYRGLTKISPSLTVNPPTLTTIVLNPTSVVGGSQSTATVTLTGVVAVDTTVSLSSNKTLATVSSTVVIPAGAQSATFVVNTTPVAANTTVGISAVYSGVTRTATLTVVAPQIGSLTLNPTSVQAGTSSVGTVTLAGPAPSTGTSVTLSSSNKLVATVPSSVVVPAGQSSVTFSVQTLLVGTSTINGTRGVTRSATLTVRLF
jgi:hypothetical protein